jgi:hypothetical protein
MITITPVPDEDQDRCNACGANGPSAYSVPEAVACWNRALRWSQE